MVQVLPFQLSTSVRSKPSPVAYLPTAIPLIELVHDTAWRPSPLPRLGLPTVAQPLADTALACTTMTEAATIAAIAKRATLPERVSRRPRCPISPPPSLRNWQRLRERALHIY